MRLKQIINQFKGLFSTSIRQSIAVSFMVSIVLTTFGGYLNGMWAMAAFLNFLILPNIGFSAVKHKDNLIFDFEGNDITERCKHIGKEYFLFFILPLIAMGFMAQKGQVDILEMLLIMFVIHLYFFIRHIPITSMIKSSFGQNSGLDNSYRTYQPYKSSSSNDPHSNPLYLGSMYHRNNHNKY